LETDVKIKSDGMPSGFLFLHYESDGVLGYLWN